MDEAELMAYYPPPASPGGTANIKQTEIDFGTTPLSEQSFVVADGDVNGTSQLIAQVAYEAPTGNDVALVAGQVHQYTIMWTEE